MSRGGVQSIAAERLAQLNAGVAAATLTECLAVDFAALMGNVLPEIDDDALTEMRQAASLGISRRMPKHEPAAREWRWR